MIEDDEIERLERINELLKEYIELMRKANEEWEKMYKPTPIYVPYKIEPYTPWPTYPGTGNPYPNPYNPTWICTTNDNTNLGWTLRADPRVE